MSIKIRICTIIAIAAAMFIASATQAFAISALDVWDNAARQALPMQVKIWLGLMMLTNIAAIGFLKNHVAARWVFGGFVISHLLVMVGFWKTGTPILAGQVSLFHIIFWTPGMIALLRCRNEITLPSAYGIWAILSLVFYFGSMVFDVPDATIYIQHLLE